MVTTLKKIHTRRYVDYEVTHQGKKTYDIHLPEQTGDEVFTITKNNQTLYEMKVNIHSINNRWSSEIFNENKVKIGQSFKRSRMANFFIGYTYYEFEFMNRHFETFLIGINGIKLLIFDVETNKQIGLAETSGVLHNNLNEWEMYAKNEQDSLITLLATLHMDYRRFTLRGPVRNNVHKVVVGSPKKLKAKYQPSFKDGVLK